MKGHPRILWNTLCELLDPAETFGERAMPTPNWDWPGLYRLAAEQLVAPVLYATLAARGRLSAVPSGVREVLEAVHLLNDERNRRLRAVLRDAVQILNRAGIEPILLKGSIALLPDQYPHAFARMMSDLDLAVDPTETERAAGALRSAGYYPQPGTDPVPDLAHQHHHLAPLFHPSGDGYIELHHRLTNARVPASALPLAIVQQCARAVTWDGTRVWIPALEHRLLHNALHHQLADDAVFLNWRSIRHLLEFAQLRRLPAAADLDWPGLLRHLDGAGVGDAVRSYLLTAQNLFGQPLPAGVAPTAAVLRAERGFAFRRDHPRLGRWRAGVNVALRRLGKLPRRLLTPAWYPAKYHHLRRRWCPPRPVPGEDHEA